MKKRPSLITSLSMILVIGTFASANAADWPAWRGPHRNGKIMEEPQGLKHLDQAKILWEAQVGQGYSSISIANGQAYTIGHDKKSQETVYCLNAATGEVIWKHSYNAELMPAMHEGGPNASPTIEGDHVYTLSKDGQAFAFRAASGEVVWKEDLKTILDIKAPVWGFSASPLILSDHIVFAAGRVAALNKETGKTVWISKESHHPGYGTPDVFEMKGRRVMAAFDGKGLSILDLANGSEIARHAFKTQYDMTAADPIVSNNGNQIFISAISQGELVEFDEDKLKSVYTTKDMRNSLNTSLLIDGYLYGIDGRHRNSNSKMVCLRLRDGRVLWTQEKFGYGSMIAAGDTLIVQAENGDVVSVAIDPEGYRELSRKSVLSGICWTPPALAGDHLYVRNEKGHVVCLQL